MQPARYQFHRRFIHAENAPLAIDEPQALSPSGAFKMIDLFRQ